MGGCVFAAAARVLFALVLYLIYCSCTCYKARKHKQVAEAKLTNTTVKQP
jgi:hypothetical protein